jgi:carbonic anhydrase/acetyltransferase-like protein (isoleucine patch superfamily)
LPLSASGVDPIAFQVDTPAGEYARAVAARSPTPANRPVTSAVDSAGDAVFIDPTARLVRPSAIHLGSPSAALPFAVLDASGGPIRTGSRSLVSDHVHIVAGGPRGVVLGDNTIIGHGATILGPARVGAAGGAPTLIGLNAIVDRATIEPGTVVMPLARVGPGVVLHSGYKVLPGKFVRTQAQADDPSLGKVAPLTDAERARLLKVADVVVPSVSEAYAGLAEQSPELVRGIGPVPPIPAFGLVPSVPTLAGQPTVAPGFPARIAGDVRLAQGLTELARSLGRGLAARADEGGPYEIGRLARVGDGVTIHASLNDRLQIGDGLRVGDRALIHPGGPFDAAERPSFMRIGDDVSIGRFAVLFNATTVGDGSVIGAFSLVDNSDLPPGTVVPRGAVIIRNQLAGTVEWIRPGPIRPDAPVYADLLAAIEW